MAVQATTVVTFGSGSSGAEYVFEVALDDTLNIGSDGEVLSSFIPGDDIYLQVNKSSNVDIVEVAVTAGKVSATGSSTRTAEVTNLFTARINTEDSENDFTITHIPKQASVSYIGKVGGVEKSVTSIGQFKYTPDKNKTPFIAKFNYTYKVSTYKWISPTMTLEGDATFDMAIVFYINVR